MAVALVHPCFWPEVRRGGERIVKELADGLLRRGQRPRLITSHPGWPRRDVEGGLPIMRNPRPLEAVLTRRGYEQYIGQVPFTYLELSRGSDDVAHAFFATDGLATARWSARTGKPCVLTYLGIPARRHLLQRRRRAEFLFRAARGSTAVTVLSEVAAVGFRKEMGIEARVIPPGVNLDAFSPGGKRAEDPTILCASPVDSEMKRVDLLVEAFRLVRRERPYARLELLRPADVVLARQLEGAVAGIELIDPVEEPRELAPAYRRAWVLALPSKGESFGLVMAEALACGTPVVGSRLGSIPEVIDRPQIGTLFDTSDPAKLAEALLDGLELSRDPATAQACRARAQDFSIERNTAAHMALYAGLLGR